MSQQELEWLELKQPEEIMNELTNEYDRDTFYVLLSGGQDSMSVADFTSKNNPKEFGKGGVVFTNTGMASPKTRKFVIDYCRERGWKLNMTWPSHNERFLLTCLRHGFAFAGNHGMWMGYCKQHTWYYFLREKLKNGEKACFISGVRKTESWARDKIKFYTKQPIDISANQIYGKPFLYKNGLQLGKYFFVNGLKKSSVYWWAKKSGECWCGSHVEPWDLKLLEQYEPLLFQTIKWIEKIMALVLQRLMKANNATEQDIAKWHKMYTDKNHKELRDLLTKRQKQMVCLTYYNKWGDQRTQDVEAQMTFDNYPKEVEIKIDEDLCGESCGVIAQ